MPFRDGFELRCERVVLRDFVPADQRAFVEFG
jgi:hypothetical protein